VSEALVMIGRNVRLSRRQVDALITALMLPIMLMLVFVYLFGGAIQVDGPYVRYVVPGVIMLCAAFGSALTATSVCQDMSTGTIDRFRSLDVSGPALLTGHVTASIARNAVSAVLVLAVAFAIGFRPHPTAIGLVAALAILLLFVAAISWLAAVVGLVARTPEAANGFTFVAMFLPYASSAFVPIGTMPAWLRGFARHQPSTPVIESIRSGLLGHPIGSSGWIAVAWCAGILLVSVALSAILFRRRTA
jgi:ABC-2 type transport system permease protein